MGTEETNIGVINERVSNLEEKVGSMEKKFEKLNDKQDDFSKNIQSLSLTMKELECTMKNSIEASKELKDELAIQKNKDTNTLDKWKSALIGAAGTGVVGYILVKLGLK